MIKLKRLIGYLFPTRRRKIGAIVLAGMLAGGGGLFLYMLRAHTYLGDSPSACVNCHIMAPYYATWFHSSHSRNATCNDCHVPHENRIKKWAFKGMDGMRHVAVFLTNGRAAGHPAERPEFAGDYGKLHPLSYPVEYGVCKDRKD